jgi:hypothetical protein
MINVPTLVFVFRQEIALLKVLCVKAYCHDAKSTCLTKDFIFQLICRAIIIPKHEGMIFVVCEEENHNG